MVIMVIEKKQSHYSTSSNNNNDCDFGFEFTQDEIEVANTLLNFPYLISNSLSDYRFPYSWGSTRRRSAVDNPPPPPPTTTTSKVVETAVEKPETTSPDTPLAFFPNGSNGKSKPSVKRTIEELQLMVDERIQTQHTLMEETDKIKLHLEKLKSENYKLKAKKQKLEACEGLNPVIECTPTQQQITTLNDQVHAGPLTSTQLHHEAPLIPHHHHGFIINQTAYIEPYFGGQPQYHQVQQLGPLGFDLNVSAEDMIAMEIDLQPLDRVTAKQARARVARKNRVQINKFKNPARVR